MKSLIPEKARAAINAAKEVCKEHQVIFVGMAIPKDQLRDLRENRKATALEIVGNSSATGSQHLIVMAAESIVQGHALVVNDKEAASER